MRQFVTVTRLQREIRQLFSHRGSRYTVLFWPVTCCAFIILLWGFVELKVAAERRSAHAALLRDATGVARAYAQAMTLSLQQMDQVSQQLKYEWEQANGTMRLEFMLQSGMFTAPQFAKTAILDRDGKLISSTVPGARDAVSISAADREYFRYHASHPSPTLRVGSPLISRRTGKWMVPLTRRLDNTESTFAGVLIVSVEPAFFTASYDSTGLGKHGLIALVGTDGELRASRTGAVVDRPDAPTLIGRIPFEGKENALLLGGKQWFTDGENRFIGWHRVDGFPLIAVAGISEAEALGAYSETWATYRYFAVGGTLGLLVFGIMSTSMAARLEWRKRVDENVRNTYRIATEGGNEGFYMMIPTRSPDDRIVDWEVVDCNEYGAKFFGMKRLDLLGMHLSAFYKGQIFTDVMKVYQAAMTHGLYEDDYEVPSTSPLASRWMYRRLVHLETGVAVTLRDISEIKEHERELIRLGNEDALTTLPNRYWMMRFLPTALTRATLNRTRTALLFVDLDGFKLINDGFGHAIGDQLLQATALRIQALLRPGDHVVRIGGDEFLVILEEAGDDEEIVPVARRIISTIGTPFDVARGPHVVGASVGISVFPRDGEDTGDLLRHADIAMYAAKASGKGRYRFYEAELGTHLDKRTVGEDVLQDALANDAFEVVYQPRVDLKNGNILSLEALVRWRQPDGELVLPGEFLPLAEESGLILRLGDAVRDIVCAQLATWRREQLPVVPVSLNLSPRQFNGALAANTEAALLRHAIAPNLLAYEVRESEIHDREGKPAPELLALQALGCELMIDEFGTGYKSLVRLKRSGIGCVKIDRNLTALLGTNREGEIFFGAILSMAHAMSLQVVAEGVETDDQVQLLRSLGCDQIQGFQIAHPMPAAAIPHLLLSGWHRPE